MNGETSTPDRDSGIMPRWQNRAPLVHRDGAVFQPNPVLCERLADVLTRVLSRVEGACIRARDTDMPEAWAWVAAWGLLARALEMEWRIASGEMPLRDGVVS